MESRADKIIDIIGDKNEGGSEDKRNENFLDLQKTETSQFSLSNAEMGMELVFKEGDEHEGNVAILKGWDEKRGVVSVNVGSAHIDDVDPSRLLVVK